jgi:site-specific DNA-methyltransferase (adenine-specific)
MTDFLLYDINTIHHADCLHLIESFPDNFIDAVITDFPYGIDFQSNHRPKKFDKIANDEEPFIDWIAPLYPKMKDEGRVICFYRYDVQNELFSELKSAGFKIKSQLVWNKVGTSMGDLEGEFAPQHELMVYATKGRYIFKNGRPSTVFSSQKVTGSNLIHPNEKPVKLNQGIIRAITERGELIFDPFYGSGSLSVAAKIEGRNFIACDLDESHVKNGLKRLKNTNVGII